MWRGKKLGRSGFIGAAEYAQDAVLHRVELGGAATRSSSVACSTMDLVCRILLFALR